jgi:hypothetical protein
MDETAVEKRGLAAIQAERDAIAQLNSVPNLSPLVARPQLAFGRSLLFGNGSTLATRSVIPPMSIPRNCECARLRIPIPRLNTVSTAWL